MLFYRSKEFYLKCNTEGISLLPLDENDLISLREIIEKHFQYTRSIIAEKILTEWSSYNQYFIKVSFKTFLIIEMV